jgi:hypothetical protein
MLGVDLTEDVRSASRLFTPQWRPAIVIVGSGLFVLVFDRFGWTELAVPLWSGIAALLLTFATKWRLRRQTWFWVVMSVFLVLHVPVVMFSSSLKPWVSVKGFVLLALLDWLVMIWMLGLVGRMLGVKPASSRAHHQSRLSTKD